MTTLRRMDPFFFAMAVFLRGDEGASAITIERPSRWA